MTQQILGPSGSPRRRWTVFVPLVAAFAFGLFYVAGAQAIHDHPDRLIQMDRDGYTATNPTLGAEDWQNVCAPGATNPPGVPGPGIGACTGNTTADSSSFVTELGQETIYTTGGSKDINSVTQWRHKNGSSPPKDELRHAFGARTENLLYFGGDRFATQGTATFGVWFLQGGVAPIAGGTFSGEHVDGDLLLVADFQASGANSAVIVFEWVGDDTTGSLQFLAGSATTPADCVGPPIHPSFPNAGSEFCATANLVNTDSPWAFQSSSGAANVWLPGLFFEGGIDLEGLGLAEKCFTNFIVQTRSSNEPNAQLKDFVAGELESCESGVVTTPSAGSDGEVSIGTGSATVSDTADITVTGVSDFGGSVTFFLCGPAPLADDDYTNALCATDGTEVSTETVTGTLGTAQVVSDDVTVTSAGRYCWRAEYSGDEEAGVPGSEDASVGECFKVTPVTPTIDTVAGADVVLGSPVTDIGTLTGTASQPGDPIIGGPLGDPADGTLTFTLVKSSDCSTLATSDDPTELNPQTVTVSGDGPYPVSFTPNEPGDYSWKASYSGDAPNTNSTGVFNDDCTDTDEDVTVTGTSSLSTAQDWLPNDTATITGDTALSGTATFTLFTGSDCGAGGDDTVVIPAEQVAVSGASPQTAETSNTTVVVVEAGSGPYSWLVTYVDDNLDDPAPSCETTNITIDDTPTP